MEKENTKSYYEGNRYQALYILLYTPEFAQVEMIFSSILRFWSNIWNYDIEKKLYQNILCSLIN